jgi:hypothetical protein
VTKQLFQVLGARLEYGNLNRENEQKRNIYLKYSGVLLLYNGTVYYFK